MNHLEHPHILSVDDYGETDGRAWLRMPLLEGFKDTAGRRLCSLADLVQPRLRTAEAQLVDYLSQVLGALEYAHAQGAIHRDIKPSNILFTEDGSLQLVDFGLVHVAGEQWLQSQVQLTIAQSMAHPTDPDATRLDDGSSTGSTSSPRAGTSTQALLGTFEFMSPEQKRGEPAAAQSDLYAVGLMAFRMLTGQEMPGFEMPSEMVEGLDVRWDGWIKRSLAPDATRRFASASEMLAELPSEPSATVPIAEVSQPTVEPEIEASLPVSPVVEAKNNEPKRQDREKPKSRFPVFLVVLILFAVGGLAYWTTSRSVSMSKSAGPESGRDWSLSLPGSGGDLSMKWIAPGSFQMGSNDGESDEKPVHRVTLSEGYHLGATEVTQAQWESVMGSNPSKFKGRDLPVEQVSWEDAMSFCAKLTASERAAGRLASGYEYTLPSEAQWEYACRAGTTGAYAGDLDSMGWYRENSGSKTHSVGTKRANAWGLYDMHGNVWEWCSDWYGSYPSGSVVDPAGARSGTFRVRRGGSWYYYASSCRSAFRSGDVPGNRISNLGFRLVHRSVQD
jgi:serine/threonine protein kinase